MELGQTTEYEDFIACCDEIVASSKHVSLNLSNTKNLYRFFRDEKLMPSNQTFFCRVPTDRNISWYDFVFSSALNGGYYYSENDEIKKWEQSGSGSAALMEWIHEVLWKGEQLPGIHLKNETDVGIVLHRYTKDLPYSSWRLDVLKEFADPAINKEIQCILMSAEQEDWSFSFTFDQVNALVRFFPKSFGGDPFRKKAILACLMMGAWLLNQGFTVYYTLPIPSDYQIPRIFHWAGVISLSDSFVTKIEDNFNLLDEASPEVTAFRAAACIAANTLANEIGIADNIVDNFLFIEARKDPDFIANSISPMKCNTTWF